MSVFPESLNGVRPIKRRIVHLAWSEEGGAGLAFKRYVDKTPGQTLCLSHKRTVLTLICRICFFLDFRFFGAHALIPFTSALKPVLTKWFVLKYKDKLIGNRIVFHWLPCIDIQALTRIGCFRVDLVAYDESSLASFATFCSKPTIREDLRQKAYQKLLRSWNPRLHNINIIHLYDWSYRLWKPRLPNCRHLRTELFPRIRERTKVHRSLFVLCHAADDKRKDPDLSVATLLALDSLSTERVNVVVSVEFYNTLASKVDWKMLSFQIYEHLPFNEYFELLATCVVFLVTSRYDSGPSGAHVAKEMGARLVGSKVGVNYAQNSKLDEKNHASFLYAKEILNALG